MQVNDKWVRILLPLLPGCLFLYIFASGGKSISTAITYIFTVAVICEVSRYLIYKSRGWFRGNYVRFKRVATLLIAGWFCTSLLLIFIKAARNYFAFGEFRIGDSYGSKVYFNNTELTVGIVGSSMFYAVIIFLFLFLVYETVYHFARLRFIEKERDQLEKGKLQAELQQLKGIVNPHFLFNNLNSLSALISENPTQAEAFLDELTKVFRYLLRNNNTELTTVGEELQFIHSYYHLLQTRYGRSIELDINVPAHIQHNLLPPLTLQLLVENAVKHNRLQREAPLKISIYQEGSCLVVRNNIFKREKPVESTGIGLNSINSRYKLLQHPGLTITEDTHLFSVMIPLIESGNSDRVQDSQSQQLTPAH